MSSKKSGFIRGLKLLSSDKAWKKVGEKDYRLKTESYDFYGKVDASCGGFNTAFVEDFTNISNTTKNNIERHFISTAEVG